jgi:RNA polymerase sigma-70 factor, ECF subfamily
LTEEYADESSTSNGYGRFVESSISGFCMRSGPSKGQPHTRLDFGEYLDGLYGYAMALSRNTSEAEDLVQETCLRALRSMDSLRADGSLKSWLFTILRNVWLNQLRHQRTVGEMVELDADGSEPNEPVDRAPDPHADYVSKFEREQVRTAIRALPVEFREIIMLREYEELSYQEIATLLDCPVGTVMSRLARARSKLRELLLAGSPSPPSGKKELEQAKESAA